MSATRRVLNPLCVETAGARRKCHHNKKHSIPKGDQCLVIKDATYGGKKNYCVQCALAILDQASDDLDSLRACLN